KLWKFFRPKVHGGSVIIKPPAEVFDEGIRKWQHSLVAQFLSYTASTLSTPLYMDNITALQQRLAYAKVCVEISVDFELPRFINVELCDGSFVYIGVEVPWILMHCLQCWSFIYSGKLCSKKNGEKFWRVKQDGVGTAQSSVPENSAII
ncbi:hypothetical protein Goarm_022516, partial [Gossypium armourianum]|nr:hypothetical protein [Gossypium armourianum]